ncbi:MAG: TetR/AcrR family transcriptional regulator [Clostridiales bacterium]|nr:TetR/AcrR family transcriptional regulator [Clostridiales bacterium]
MKQGKRYQRMEQTRAQVLRYAVELFLEQGYQETTLDQIAERIDRTKGAVLRAYPDKESILYALVTHMFRVQFSTARSLLGEKADPLLVYCVETAMQLHICELGEPLRDLYTSAYTLPTTSDFIYRSTAQELRLIFGKYLPDAAQSDFYELDLVSGGVMRGLMARKCDMYFTIEKKITLFLRCVLKIYDVPAQERETVIPQVLAMDLAAMARSTVENTVRLAQAGFDMETLRASAADERKEDML